MEKEIKEIPFGAKDSELNKFEYTIPEGYEAEIKDGKVIIMKKVSEDERIRKSLVEYFGKFKPGNMWNEVFSFGDVLSYLEKQKDKRELDFAEGKVEGVRQTCQEIKDAMSLFEPKDLTPFEFTFRDYIDSAIRYCLAGEGYQQYIKEWAADLLNLERQNEQKLESCDCSRDEENYTNGIHHVLMNPEAYGLIKQKPAEWSEEDEMAFGDLMWCIEQARKSAKDENDMGNIWFAENWAKNRLKSLRPSWKPSEEQRHIEGQDTCYLNKQSLVTFIEDCIAENLENTTDANHDNHEGYHQACWDIIYRINQMCK